ESVQNQTYSNVEIIIVDDCSTDGTHDYLKEVVNQDSRVKYFLKEKNSGATISRNIVIQNAPGTYIT
ncbi:glycosyltransferase family 2 protein, partial [Micrococcus sp. SIMBA_131]